MTADLAIAVLLGVVAGALAIVAAWFGVFGDLGQTGDLPLGRRAKVTLGIGVGALVAVLTLLVERG